MSEVEDIFRDCHSYLLDAAVDVDGEFGMTNSQYSQQIYRSTIDTIENKYMKNCHKMWLPHWRKIRKQMFKELLAVQLKEWSYD